MDFTVKRKRILDVFMLVDGQTKKAYHHQFDLRHKVSCPCGIGQVERFRGSTCRYCNGVVMQVTERRE